MVTTAEALSVLYPSAVMGSRPGDGDYVVSDNVIVYWSPLLGAQPTQAQLDAVTAQQVTDAGRAREPLLRDLLDDAAARIAAIDTYIAIASPTNAQVQAEFRRNEVAQKRTIQALVRLIQREWRS